MTGVPCAPPPRGAAANQSSRHIFSPHRARTRGQRLVLLLLYLPLPRIIHRHLFRRSCVLAARRVCRLEFRRAPVLWRGRRLASARPSPVSATARLIRHSAGLRRRQHLHLRARAVLSCRCALIILSRLRCAALRCASDSLLLRRLCVLASPPTACASAALRTSTCRHRHRTLAPAGEQRLLQQPLEVKGACSLNDEVASGRPTAFSAAEPATRCRPIFACGRLLPYSPARLIISCQLSTTHTPPFQPSRVPAWGHSLRRAPSPIHIAIFTPTAPKTRGLPRIDTLHLAVLSAQCVRVAGARPCPRARLHAAVCRRRPPPRAPPAAPSPSPPSPRACSPPRHPQGNLLLA